ncbi:MAG TPA: DUF2203 domain-containing protein [Candidatus Thermoplasmatota archaeon]|nr:DUF2203 domain-containing protein [Candidatus Thermoplasmatota archaeon]
MRPHEFTVEEANALLPRLREILPVLREAAHQSRFLAEQLADLRRMTGAAVDDPASEAHKEAQRLVDASEEQAIRVRAAAAELQALGVEIKDPVLGLVDFYGRREGELVYLCWREDEARVEHWHPLVGGFTARKRL